MFDIPIITYHKISDNKEFGLTTVSQSQFAEQMDYLSSNGYKPICFNQLNSNRSLPEKPVIITFDDGYESVYQNAVPIMDSFGFKSVVFIVTSYLGKLNRWEAVSFQRQFRHLSKDQILKLRDRGHEIGSHGKMHTYLPKLDNMALREEIGGSKADLEDILEEEIISFCYPYGRFTERVLSFVENAGYQYATSNPKINNGNLNLLSLTRRSIYSTDSLTSFKAKISSPPHFSPTLLIEILIQKGALASIGLNFLKTTKSHF
jgi:peptidoglycan/xylan/chitin deacetylase (PgdA/CDA1 family)